MSTDFFPHIESVPVDKSISEYTALFGNVMPTEYTGWKDEVMSWKNSCYIHGGLNPTDTVRITGPDATKFLEAHIVNSFAKYEIGQAKHAVMCDEQGLITAHGVLVKQGENDYMSYWLMPWLKYVADNSNYDVTLEDLTGQYFLFQIAGPRSLEILESVTGESLRDIRFLRQRPTNIKNPTTGSPDLNVNILRLGMAGSLAYELHGPIEIAHAVWDAVVKSGEPYGIQRLGRAQYRMNHTENGFPNGYMHFFYPWFENPELVKAIASSMIGPSHTHLRFSGSAGPNPRLRYRTPYDLGWGNMVKFDHDFMGRAALEPIAANPPHKIVTLVWNHEDILDIYRSHFEEGGEHRFMDFRYELMAAAVADLVLKNGETVGLSTGRTYSYYYRKMISICPINVDQAEIGNEVIILWGEPGTNQKEIRATVERYPFFNEQRNEKLNVAAL